MLEIVMVRHGETDWNVEPRIQGQTDVLLNANGRAQAQSVGERLAAERFDAIYVSDLRRTRETADAILAHYADPAPVFDARLRERGLGEWETYVWAEVAARDPEIAARYESDPEVGPRGGETGAAFVARVAGFLAAIRATHTDDRVLVVAHGGSIRVLVCVALGIDPRVRRLLALDNTALSVLRFEGDAPLLVTFNDTAHLRNGRG